MTIQTIVNENIIVPSETTIDFDDFDNSNVTYQALILRCTELCRTVQNDQTQCRSVMSGIIEWTKKLRMKDSFRTVFLNNASAKNNDDNDSFQTAHTNQPLHAITKQASTDKASHRLVSAREYHNSKYKSKPNKVMMGKDDVAFLPAKRNTSRSCGLCRGVKHTQYSCDKITKNFKCIPLPKNDSKARRSLALKIVNVSGMALFPRHINDKRIIFDDCPNKQKALVIHKRYVIMPTILHCEVPENICIECTFLGEGGYPTKEYHRALFKVASVASYILKSKSNCVASQID